MTKEEEISEEELDALTQAILNKYGIDFTNYERRSLKRGFSRLMRKNGIDSLLSLWSTILKDRDFFKNCIDDLTVNLTELFRNPEIWESMGSLLENLSGNSEINIWHAGCATGEEVYSMAMVAMKKDMLYKLYSLGTDISSTALNRAENGTYPIELLRKYEKSLKKYLPTGNITDMFKIDSGKASVIEELKRNTSFRYHNLVSDHMTEKFDIVFCRNVMIYFDDSLKMKVLEKLTDALKPEGFLVLGYYDMLPEECREIIEPFDSNHRIYTACKSSLFTNQIS